MRGHRIAAAVAVLGATDILGAGCSGANRYLESRALDLWDIVPVSVRAGLGADVSVRATAFLGTGLGAYEADAAGLAPGRWGPSWRDGAADLIFWTGKRMSLAGSRGPRDGPRPRWPGGPDPRWLQKGGAGLERQTGNVFLVFPVPAAWWSGTPVIPPWYSWLDVETEVFLGVAGVRLGLCPVEIADFLAGLVGLDLLGDDVDGERERRAREERGAPAAAPPGAERG
jgi:hypothetical protein